MKETRPLTSASQVLASSACPIAISIGSHAVNILLANTAMQCASSPTDWRPAHCNGQYTASSEESKVHTVLPVGSIVSVPVTWTAYGREPKRESSSHTVRPSMKPGLVAWGTWTLTDFSEAWSHSVVYHLVSGYKTGTMTILI